jgi:GNAT superfamily N-acetyltransferase
LQNVGVVQPLIRRATISDIPQMYAISLRTHQLSYANLIPFAGRRDFKRCYTASKQAEKDYFTKLSERMNAAEWHIWVAEISGNIAGCAFEKRETDNLIMQRGLFVDPLYHRQGIGEALFRTSLGIAKKGDTVKLSVIENNYRAKRLYMKYGFTVTGCDNREFFGARLEVMELIAP